MKTTPFVLALVTTLCANGQTILINPPDDLSSSIYIPCKVSGNGNKIVGIRCDTLESEIIRSFVWWDKDGEVIAERYAPQYCNKRAGSLSFDGNSILAWSNSDGLNDVYRVSPAVIYYVGQDIFTDNVSRPPVFALDKDVFGFSMECNQEFTLPTLYPWINGHQNRPLMTVDCGQTRLFPGSEWSPLLPMIGYISGVYGIWYYDEISQSVLNHFTITPSNSISVVDSSLSYAVINQDLVSLEDGSAKYMFLNGSSDFIYSNDSSIATTSQSLKIIDRGYYQVVIGNIYSTDLNSTWIYNSKFDGQTATDFLDGLGFLPENFVVKQITGISDDGKTICGMGEETGIPRGFISKVYFTRPPCLGDYNNDGSIEAADVESFYIDWEAGIADVNGDESIDSMDAQIFWTAWENGSCQ